jgi:integral membrane protein
MSVWLALRFLKFVGIALFASGILGAALLPGQRERQLAAYGAATSGFVATWLAGYGLMKLTGRTMADPSISMAMLASLVALQAAVFAARPATRSPAAAALAVAGLASSVGVMVVRGGGAEAVPLGLIVPVLLGALAAWFARGAAPAPASDAAARTIAWFWACARAEGLSLVLLMCVSMPLKYGLGIQLDGGQGWIGWVHGVLTILFLLALGNAAGAAGWRLPTMAGAFVASLVPFGTFVFERRVRTG